MRPCLKNRPSCNWRFRAPTLFSIYSCRPRPLTSDTVWAEGRVSASSHDRVVRQDTQSPRDFAKMQFCCPECRVGPELHHCSALSCQDDALSTKGGDEGLLSRHSVSYRLRVRYPLLPSLSVICQYHHFCSSVLCVSDLEIHL